MNTAVAPAHRRLLRRVTVVAAAGLLVAWGVPPTAWAAPPANDDPDGAVAISLGDHITLDTTEATTTDEDAELNVNCGAPETKASVWYSFTSATDTDVFLIMTAANTYSGGFLVFEGEIPGADSLVTCGQFAVQFSAAADTTYSVMVVDDDLDGDTANGGTLDFDVSDEPPPSPTVEVTVDPRGRVDKVGVALISGSYTCTNGDFIDIEAELRQTVGRLNTITGFAFVSDDGTCDGTAHPFTLRIAPDEGKFAGGKAASVVFTFACGAFECAEGFSEQIVQLSKGSVK